MRLSLRAADQARPRPDHCQPGLFPGAPVAAGSAAAAARQGRTAGRLGGGRLIGQDRPLRTLSGLCAGLPRSGKELGIQPRQLQSAVWVVKRDTFGKALKFKVGLRTFVNRLLDRTSFSLCHRFPARHCRRTRQSDRDRGWIGTPCTASTNPC